MTGQLALMVIVGLAMALALPGAAGAQETINASVIRVIDGDTIEVQPASGAPTTVRLLGIDAPESVAPGTQVECGSEDAAAYLTELLLRLPDVVLTTDPSQDRIDRFGRLLAYVDAGTTDVALAMIRAGHADVLVFEGRPFARLPTYEDAQAEASTAERGAWGACGGDFHSPRSPGRHGDRVARPVGRTLRAPLLLPAEPAPVVRRLDEALPGSPRAHRSVLALAVGLPAHARHARELGDRRAGGRAGDR
jgi:micrococcal nuclease